MEKPLPLMKRDSRCVGTYLILIYFNVNYHTHSQILDAAYERGSTFWDTADIYNDNEELIGKWLKRTGKRAEVFIATKFGYYSGGGNRVINGDPEYVREAAERSLKKLDVSTIDLLFLHVSCIIIQNDLQLNLCTTARRCYCSHRGNHLSPIFERE